MIEKLELNRMKEISDFVKKKNIPKDETVYIGGDLNVNKGTPRVQRYVLKLECK